MAIIALNDNWDVTSLCVHVCSDAAATFKELEMIKSDKKKLEGQVVKYMGTTHVMTV